MAKDKDTIRIYPTHRAQAGALTIHLPAIDGNSPEPIVVTDEGADVPKAVAQLAIAFRDATTTAPEVPEADEDTEAAPDAAAEE